MSEENGCEVMETIEEIVREMRIIGGVEEKPTDQIPSCFQSPGLRMFADCIEAAAKREREAGADETRTTRMRNEINETISDIVSEMREFSDTDSQTIGRDVLRKRIQDFARRIEQSVTNCNRIGNFAKILEALELIHELLGIKGKPDTAMCIRYEAAYQIAKEALFSTHKREHEETSEDSSVVGNVAKMHEALEKFNAVDLSWLEFPLDGDSSTIYNSNKKEITIPYWRVAELLNEVKAAHDMAKAALSAPPRNCDVLEGSIADDEFEKAMGFQPSKTADERDEIMRENWFLFKHWLFSEAKEE